MSLLMDALKKAELAKRQGQYEGARTTAEAGAHSGLALESIAMSRADRPAAAARLRTATPSVAVREPPGERPAAARMPPPAAAFAEPRRAPPGQDKSAAQNLFATKQTDEARPRKMLTLAVGMLTIVAVAAIGDYFWWQLPPKNALVASRTPLPPSAAAASSVVAAAVLPASTVAPAAGMTGTAGPAVSTADDEDDGPVAAKVPAAARRVISVPSAPAAPEPPVRISKAPLTINPALMRGFDAFNRGDLAAAQSEYEQAQQADPRNTDALHGLAAIAIRQGHFDQAELRYRHIAEIDPQDGTAMSALINMRGQLDPNAAESRLKSLSAAQPELAAPHFSLGNLYARQGRWNEAQQAYFRAHSAEPENPDIAYNLAISLEHLRQNKLAAQYYSQAIAAAQGRPSGFDKTEAAARLRTLQP